MKPRILFLCGGLALAGCAPIIDTVKASLIDALTNTLAPGVNTAIADGVNATRKDVAVLMYALPWAQKAVDYLGPSAGMTADRIAVFDAAIVAAEGALANPPTTLGEAAIEATYIWQRIRTALTPAIAAK